jgi:protein-S-isoprenylcysteine O-methyltransferase Ste14
MRWLPIPALGLLNGWLPMVLYFGGPIAMVLTFPKPARKRLFFEPAASNPVRRLVILVGRVAAVVCHALWIVSPLRGDSGCFWVRLLVYLVGYATVMRSLLDYRRAPMDLPIEVGLYRRSRNPQWLGLAGVFSGTALMVATWVQMASMAALVVCYHAQILNEEDACLSYYSEAYRQYMARVPRYLPGL